MILALALAATTPTQFGVNLAGCYVSGSLCPNQDDVDWWVTGQSFKLVRLPFKDSTPIADVNAATDRLLAADATVILDRHQFKWPSVDEQVTFWTARIDKYKNNPKVMIDLMNEPRGFNDPVVTNDYAQWASDSRKIIAGLRGNGIGNTVLVEWPGSSAAFRFDKHERVTPTYVKPCESAMCAVDRQGGLGDTNVIFSPHMYFDRGSSGINRSCQPYLVLNNTRIAAVQRGYKLLLGEAAFGSWQGIPASCSGVGKLAVQEIKSHPETWVGVTWWGAGREWPSSYVFAAGPKGHRTVNAYIQALEGK